MSTETIRAKIAIAKELQKQSAAVFAFRTKHFATLSLEDRLKLKDASRTLDARADEVLEDALEEGTRDAEELIQKLEARTRILRDDTQSLDQVADLLKTAATVSKVAAGVISGGISSALALLA